MAAGQAILALCPRNSDLADIVLENNCGWVVDPGDPSALKETLERIAQDTESIHINRCNAYRAANANYGMPIVAGMWAQLIKSLSRDATGLIRRQ
jgi:glycosyltransferase involved in cell wall biosynthesis